MIELRQFASVGRSLVATQDFRAGETVLSDAAVLRWSGDAALPPDVAAAVAPYGVPTFLMAAVHAFAGRVASPNVVRVVLEMHVPDLPIGRSSADLYRACDAYVQAFPAVAEALAGISQRTLGTKAAAGDTASVLVYVAMAAKVNSHRAANGDWCLFATASKLAHSCDPNLFFLPPNAQGECTFVATRTIVTDELLSFSYLGGPALQQASSIRQRRLQASHLFVCQCRRCADFDNSRQLRCPNGCASHHYAGGIAAVGVASDSQPPLIRRHGSELTKTDDDAFPAKPWLCRCCGGAFTDKELRAALMEEARIVDAVDAINPAGYKLDALREIVTDAVSELGYGHHAYAGAAQHLMAYFRIMIASGAKDALPVFMCWAARYLDALVLQRVEAAGGDPAAFPHMLAASAVQSIVGVVAQSGDAAAAWVPAATAMAREVAPYFAAVYPGDKRSHALAAFAKGDVPPPRRAAPPSANCSRVTRALVEHWPAEYCAHIGLPVESRDGSPSQSPAPQAGLPSGGMGGNTLGRPAEPVHGLLRLLELWDRIVASKQLRQAIA